MFSVHIEGQVDDAGNAGGEEQALLDDLIAVVKKHDSKITYAAGSNFSEHDDIDLIAAAQVDQPPETGGGGGEPTTFEQFVAGETFPKYDERLFAWNLAHQTPETGQVATADQMNQAEFDALHANDAPAMETSPLVAGTGTRDESLAANDPKLNTANPVPEANTPVPQPVIGDGDVVHTRLIGDTYSAYVARATEAGATTVLDEADWKLLTPVNPTA